MVFTNGVKNEGRFIFNKFIPRLSKDQANDLVQAFRIADKANFSRGDVVKDKLMDLIKGINPDLGEINDHQLVLLREIADGVGARRIMFDEFLPLAIEDYEA